MPPTFANTCARAILWVPHAIARTFVALVLSGLMALSPALLAAQTAPSAASHIAPMVPLADGSAPDPAYLIAQQTAPKPAAPAAAPGAKPAPPAAKPADTGKELVAVLDLEPVGATKVEASAMTDRLREELLKTGKFTMVDRSQMSAVLDEQAIQQTGCTSQECAVQVGKVLGVKKLITGKITKISETQWLVNATILDVETSETLRAESLPFKGDYFSMLTDGIGQLAAKLSTPTGEKPNLPAYIAAQQAAKPAAQAPPQPPPAEMAKPPPKPGEQPQPEEEKKGSSVWWWIAGGAAVVAVAAAAGGKGGGGGGGGKSSPNACASGCGSITGSW
jgi:uncharacterized protein DUF2380